MTIVCDMDFSNPILIDLPMPIVTPRLILRNCQPGDGVEMHEMKIETWDEIHRWMPWATELGTPDESEVNIREAYVNFIQRKDIRIHGYERETGRMVLCSGLHRFTWALRRFEIGFWVRASAQGQGYATESTNALIRYAFEVLDARAVKIEHAEGNEKSKRVIEKLGLEYEGIKRAGQLLPDGNIVDHPQYSRTSLDGLPDLDVCWG